MIDKPFRLTPDEAFAAGCLVALELVKISEKITQEQQEAYASILAEVWPISGRSRIVIRPLVERRQKQLPDKAIAYWRKAANKHKENNDAKVEI